jgi:KaiC/GvpD/RAD55 family RecA-like ATPase
MLVYPLGGGLQDTTYTRNYRVIIADRVLKSEGNELEVESDTELMCTDVLAYFRRQGQENNYVVSDSATIQQFWEKWTDEVTGNFIDLTFDDYFDYNSCVIPLR